MPFEYVPAPHVAHFMPPTDALPAAQGMHLPAASRSWPPAHGVLMMTHAVAPVPDVCLPPAQTAHVLCPFALEYVSLPHFRHEVAPGAGAYLPASHTAHSDDPALPACFPTGHALQDACPNAVVYVPAAHNEQLLAPAWLYVPTAHSSQVLSEAAPISLLYLPARHGVSTADPNVEYVPCRALLQLVMLYAGWYLPAGQNVGSALPRCSEYEPGGTSVQLVEPGMLYLPEGQTEQEEDELDPTSVEYFPPGHMSHNGDPKACEYCPPGQSSQAMLPSLIPN